LVAKIRRKDTTGRPSLRREDKIGMDLREIGWG
jgi:hypothetical protein